MNFFKKQKFLLKQYFSNTNIITIIISFIYPTLTILCSILALLINNLPILVIINLFTLILFAVYIIYIKKNFIKITNLSLENKTFLINMVTNIVETKKLKEKNPQFNGINVSNLHITFTIGKALPNSPKVSDLNVQWEIMCKPNDKPITQYDVVFSKCNTNCVPLVTAKAKLFNGKDVSAHVSMETNTKILNHYRLTFKDINIGESEILLTINLSNYYNFLWGEYETLLFNPYIWGKTIDEAKITVIFLDKEIENTDISLYIVNQNNFSREKLKCHQCSKSDTGEYVFEYIDNIKKQDHSFFLIEIPPQN